MDFLLGQLDFKIAFLIKLRLYQHCISLALAQVKRFSVDIFSSRNVTLTGGSGVTFRWHFLPAAAISA